MIMAFGISQDDVAVVLSHRFKVVVDFDDPVHGELFDRLDVSSIEKCALRGDDMDDQTDAAHEEIYRQLVEDPSAMESIGKFPATPRQLPPI